MFLSRLKIEIGNSLHHPGRLWLRNLYRVHQRLCMAFPSNERRKCDPDFLAPYAREDFPEQRRLAVKKKGEVDANTLKHVHRPRGTESGFLYRIDPQPRGGVAILVQSAVEPDWDYALHNAQYLLAAPPEVKSFDPGFAKGERLRFRLAANPTKRFSKNSREKDGEPVADRWVGKRVPVPTEQLFEWLARRAETAGFSLEKNSITVQPGYIYWSKTLGGDGQRLRSVRYDGILAITDPKCFQETLVRGIGPGKAFGFGLLSVAPVKSSSG
jgi:CRISPR system Cascade subunit CasE